MLSLASLKGQGAWSSVKTKVLKRWSQRSSETANAPGQDTKWPQDAEDSLFCDSLLGLMRQCGRFDYLSGDDDKKQS